MIRIRLHCQGKDISGFEIWGHSGYSEAGSDIVCAGVSALAQTALLGLIEYMPDKVQYVIDEGSLSVVVTQPDRVSHIILHTMKLGMEQIVQQYGEYAELHFQTSGGGRDV